MRVILGINANHADSSACIIHNGKLIFAHLDEKLSQLELSGRKIYAEFKSKAATAVFG